MEASATYKYARLSPQKCRLVADTVRGRRADVALAELGFNRRAGARVVHSALHSAVANAASQHGLEAEDLFVKEIRVNKSFMIKRFLPRAKGRATPLLKRQCHVYVVVTDTPARRRAKN